MKLNLREKADAVSARGVLAPFTGRGTWVVGMRRRAERTSPAAAAVFDAASDVMAVDARGVCRRALNAELKQTENARPAITITALASWAAVGRDLADSSTLMAGPSVGAISAAAAGYLSVSTVVELAVSRRKLMDSVGSQWHDMVDAVEMEPALRSSYQASILGTRTHNAEDVRQALWAGVIRLMLWSRVMVTVMLFEIQAFGPSGILARLALLYCGGRRATQVDDAV